MGSGKVLRIAFLKDTLYVMTLVMGMYAYSVHVYILVILCVEYFFAHIWDSSQYTVLKSTAQHRDRI